MKGCGMYYLKDIYVAPLYQEAAVRASGAGRPFEGPSGHRNRSWGFYGPANNIVTRGEHATPSPVRSPSLISRSYNRFNNLDYNELAVGHRATCREHLNN